MNGSVAAIVLAAGASSRLGRAKQLIEYRGETLIERVIRLAQEAGAAPVVVVLGAGYESIHALVSQRDAIPVLNYQWKSGISSSIHAGLKGLEVNAAQACGAVILACDQPRLTAKHLRALIGAFQEEEAKSIVASAYADVVGIPAIFPRAVFPDLLALQGDKGARALLAQAPCPVTSLGFPGGDVDIDSPQDLAELE